jgi:hypothetical protein
MKATFLKNVGRSLQKNVGPKNVPKICKLLTRMTRNVEEKKNVVTFFKNVETFLIQQS